MATKRFENLVWIVGDLAESPFRDQSFHIILNQFSPSNYREFKRIVVPNGLVIKVVLRPNYLKELRVALYGDTNIETNQNDDTVALFKKHFHLKKVLNVCYQKSLDQEELKNVAQMTPLSWKSKKSAVEAFTNGRFSKITIDLDLLIGLIK